MSQTYEEKVPVTIYGTDAKGEMFIEDTHTLTLAKEWVKVFMRHKAPEGSELIIFNKNNGSQAEFLMKHADGNTVTAEIKDQSVDVWDKGFGAAAPAPPGEPLVRIHLVCKSCGTQESVMISEHENERALGGAVLWRHCAYCVAETDWQAKVVVEKQLATKVAPPPLPPPPPPPPVVMPALLRPSTLPSEDEEEEEEMEAEADAPAAPAAAAAAAGAAPAEPINWAERRSSRRIMMKTRARVRRASGAEVVSPLNVSKGGVGFSSRSSYALDEVIYVALHYTEGGEIIETPGTIVRVTKGKDSFEYGVRYN